MRILQINTRYHNGGSTGRIVYDLRCVAENHGIESYVAFGFGYDTDDEKVYRIEDDKELFISKVKTKLTGHHGFNNDNETRRLLKWIEKIRPDLIHMHNIHNHYVNVEMLLNYIADHNLPCVLTMHDCWTFTGHCAYFDYSGCERWRTGCYHCPSLRDYPRTFALIDPSPWNYRHKRELFSRLNITFVSPSQWLADLHRQSFLKDKPCIVINNGVDTKLMRPIESDIKKRIGVGERKMILAVSAGLTVRKGRTYLLELPAMLHDDEVMVLVGLNKGQDKVLPKTNKIIGLQRTKTAAELVELYSSADVFINPTLEDNFPTTNLEALSCGTPVVTFRTGGSAEVIDSSSGIAVDKGDTAAFIEAIRLVLNKGKEAYRQACRDKALKDYDKDIQYAKYLDLYKSILD